MQERAQKRLGRSLKLYLVDGTPTGVIVGELGNWSGKAVVAPRAALPNLIQRDEARRTGVYLLMGPDPDAAGRTLVYVGESDNVQKRLSEHDDDDSKQFFARVCLVVSKDENLTKAHGRYLESRLIAAIKTAGRAKLVNGTEPDFKGLPESEIADMQGFLSEIEVLLPVLGFDILRPPADSGAGDAAQGTPEPTFVYTGAGTNAQAKESGGEFVVLAGSFARVRETNTCHAGARAKRRQLIEDGVLVPEPEGKLYRFARDAAFDSPSGALDIVYGGSISGPLYWKEKETGLTYRDWRARKLQAAQSGTK
jgi:hypothetical protein